MRGRCGSASNNICPARPPTLTNPPPPNSADRELYASLANATLSFLKAALTLEQADLQAALSAINLSFEVSSQRRRKQSTASMVMRFLYRPNYNLYTDDQIHAELVHAESLLLLALISFLADQSIICLVKGAFRIRACYQRYKECLYIMENRTQWASQEAQCHFESGVRMGHGIFNLLMSYLPRRVLRFLEYVGFSGNRSIGIDELDRSVELSDGLRSVFSALVILTYHSYVENLFGLGDYDELKVEQLNKTFLGHYPNSAFFLLFLGRYHQMRGQHAEAIASFQRCIEAQNDWKQFHSVCHWEIMWCHASQMDWRQAAHYSDLLRKQSKWSPASYTYQYATFLYAQLVEDQRAGLYDDKSEQFQAKLAEIHEIMLQVPKLRIRYAGKTIPAEKFAITRSVRFCEQSDRLTLPALEFLYIWNQFPTLRNAPRQLERLMQRIDSEIDHLQRTIAKEEAPDGDQADEEEESKPSFVDELSLLYLLKGMCLKHLDRFAEAELCFMEIMEREHDIERDTFLVPHTAMELATLNLSLKQHEQARNWIKLARSNYTGYLLETIVHFRLHAASRLIRLEQMEQELAGASWESADSNGARGHHLMPDKTKRSAATTSKLTPVN